MPKIKYNMYYSTYDGFHFQRKNRYLWKIKEGYMYAELVNKYYINHRKYMTLEEGLLRLK